MSTHPLDVPRFDDDGLAEICLEFPAGSFGEARFTWRVDAETLDAVLALLDERAADS